MRAIVHTEYGPPNVLRLMEIARPAPRDDQVLIRILAASVNPLDWHFMRGTPYLVRASVGLRRPRPARLGVDVAGQVEAVGSDVRRFKPGDEVFGTCRGAFAEFACASEAALVPKPANLTFAQAAAVPVAGSSALQGLRDKGRIQSGQKVLVNGAAGGVGTFAVQIARVYGANVTGVCSTRNVDMVRAIGAHQVTDYTREDFTRSGRRYDLILDLVGNRSLSDCRRALTDHGTLVLAGGPDRGRWLGPLSGVLRAVVSSPFVGQNLRPFLAHPNTDDLMVLRELLASGQVAPVIDRVYALSEVAQAIRYLEEGHARGKVAIAVDHPGEA